MNLLKTIVFIGLATQLIHCGNQSESTVKVAKVENGVPKAEDGRIILSSQSEDKYLHFPRTRPFVYPVRSQQVGIAIAKQLNDIVEVYDISVEERFYLGEVFSETDYFSTSFTAKTASGDVFNFTCKTHALWSWGLKLENCISDQAVLRKTITIRFLGGPSNEESGDYR